MEAAVAGAQGRVEKVTEALAQIGYSEPLAAKLRAEEARLLDARQALATAAAVATPEPVSRAYSARAVLAVVKHLATAATATPLKAKELLGAVVDAILMQPTPDGYAVRVTLKNTNPAALEGSGAGDYKTGCGGPMEEPSTIANPSFPGRIVRRNAG